VLLVIQVQCWWSMFGLREQTDWTFLKFMVVLLQPIILYLQAIVVLPGASSTTLDLRSNYYAQRGWFFGLMIALLVRQRGQGPGSLRRPSRSEQPGLPRA
jgi:hypothetical protein